MKRVIDYVRAPLAATFVMAALVGLLYPAAVWLIGQGIAPDKAAGSLVMRHGQVLGSSLLGQKFTGPGYFHSRPSAAGTGYDATASGGSNRGPLSSDLIRDVRDRVDQYRIENELARSIPVPADAVTASGSGLDPHISPENAALQAARIARARGLTLDAVMAKVKKHTEERTLGFLGEPRVNVLLLNLDLDGKL